MSSGAMGLPWHDAKTPPPWAVGVMARDEGAKSPGRLIASAKSWLCHSGVDRAADLLPWQGAADVERLSPVTASSRYLSHIRSAWDAQFPNDLLSEQDVVITLPASFDEVARELTVQAAAAAGLPRVVLIEEPQAAFYAWINKHSESWQDQVGPGQTILVCDIGGGTSDFTLIKVRESEVSDTRQVQFHRIAVGNHLILGGDNLDLTLAHHVEKRLAEQTEDGRLTPNQWDVLVRTCRRVKEELLGPNAPDSTTINLPGSGSKLIGGGLQAVVHRDEVMTLLVDGFLPKTGLADNPVAGQSGFREFGLPFASDPAMTRHLAAFLNAHLAGESRHDGSDMNDSNVRDDSVGATNGPDRPDVLLFNGGFFASPVLRGRLLSVISSWYGDEGWQPVVLENDRLDLAVARGAAYYGMVRRGEGIRIAANLARSYYIGVESESDEPTGSVDDGAKDDPATCLAAVCLIPGNSEPGQTTELNDRVFDLAVSQPVEFSLFVSSTRLTDAPGEIVPFDPEQMKALPPIRTVLKTQRRSETGTIPVKLIANLSEIGTIDLWCQSAESDRRWRLQFDVRSATETDMTAHESAAEQEGVIDEQAWVGCADLLRSVFGPDATEKPGGLVKRLSEALDIQRDDWPTSLLRRIWETLMELELGRRCSPSHEARWLNLLGYALRPGFGLAVDDWRVSQTWRSVRGKLAHKTNHAEALILWRRIAGGLSAGQQVAIAEPLVSSLRVAHAASTAGKRRGTPAIAVHESSEAWRLLGSLELLGVPTKTQLGKMIVDLLPKRKYDKVRGPMIWAIGRIGQRVPVYGPLNTVVPVEQATDWAQHLIDNGRSIEGTPLSTTQLALMQLTRKTSDRYRDLGESARDGVSRWLRESGASRHLINLVTQGGQLDSDEQDQVFGETLPKGLRLRRAL